MDIKTTKINLIKEILEIDNPLLLQSISDLIKKENFIINDTERVNEQVINYESTFSSDIKRKLKFIKEYLSLENKETIHKLENILWGENNFWNELTQSQKKEIKQGIKQLDKGKRYSYESVLKEIS